MRTLIAVLLVAGAMLGCERPPRPEPMPDVYLGRIVDVKIEPIHISGIGEHGTLMIYTLDNGKTACKTVNYPPQGLLIGGYLYQTQPDGNLIIKPTPDAMRAAGKEEE